MHTHVFYCFFFSSFALCSLQQEGKEETTTSRFVGAEIEEDKSFSFFSLVHCCKEEKRGGNSESRFSICMLANKSK